MHTKGGSRWIGGLFQSNSSSRCLNWLNKSVNTLTCRMLVPVGPVHASDTQHSWGHISGTFIFTMGSFELSCSNFATWTSQKIKPRIYKMYQVGSWLYHVYTSWRKIVYVLFSQWARLNVCVSHNTNFPREWKSICWRIPRWSMSWMDKRFQRIWIFTKECQDKRIDKHGYI